MTLKETIQFCQTLDFFTSRKIQVDVLENTVSFGVQTMCVMIETTTNRFRQSEGHSRRRSLLLLLLDLLLASLVQTGAARRNEADLHPRRTVEGCPMCWWLPPPCGCSTGFIATPRTLGQQLRFTRYLWKLFPALRIGLSRRPPPATIPITARAVAGIVRRAPDGMRTRVFLPSSEWPTMMQEVP